VVIDPSLEAVVRQAMAKTPDNRYATAAEMRTDLLRVLAGERPDAPAVLAEYDRVTGPEDPTDPGRRGAAVETTGEMSLTQEVTRGSRRRGAVELDHGPRTGAHAAARTSGSRWRLGAAVIGLVALLVLGVVWVASPSDSEVPRLVGLSRDEAVRALADAGLSPIVVPTSSPPEQVDRVIGASPDVGVRVDEESAVTLRIGRGPGLVQVPLLVGRSPEAARVAAEAAGLVLTPVPRQRETSDPTEIGQVVGQDPVPGSLRPAGGAIELIVGQRRATLQVPDLAGRSRQSAESTLEGIGLEVSFREVDGGAAGTVAGTVVGMRPSAGTAVPRGSTVTVEVARGSGSAPTSAPSGDTGSGADGSETGDSGGATDGGDGTGDGTGASEGDDGFFDLF
jgi:eukaryotic-like serine/threonine-protein kinase